MRPHVESAAVHGLAVGEASGGIQVASHVVGDPGQAHEPLVRVNEGEAVMGPVHHDEGVGQRTGQDGLLEFLRAAPLAAIGLQMGPVLSIDPHLPGPGIDHAQPTIGETVGSGHSEELIGIIAFQRADGQDGLRSHTPSTAVRWTGSRVVNDGHPGAVGPGHDVARGTPRVRRR